MLAESASTQIRDLTWINLDPSSTAILSSCNSGNVVYCCLITFRLRLYCPPQGDFRSQHCIHLANYINQRTVHKTQNCKTAIADNNQSPLWSVQRLFFHGEQGSGSSQSEPFCTIVLCTFILKAAGWGECLVNLCYPVLPRLLWLQWS